MKRNTTTQESAGNQVSYGTPESHVSDPRNPGILLAVSRLYYENDLSKTKIAEIYKTNATQVARWLERARAERIVEVMFNPPRFAILEERLKARFDCLREVVVAAIPDSVDFPTYISLLGRTAAVYFERVAVGNRRIALSGGSTMTALVEALPQQERSVRIYPTAIMGRGPHIGEHIDPMVTVTLLWAKCGRVPNMAYCATVPPYRSDVTWENAPARKQEWLDIKRISEVYEGMQEADVVIASLGPVDAAKEYFDVTGPTIIREVTELGVSNTWLHKQNIVGDINYAFFDTDGQSKQEWEFFLTIPIPTLRQMAAHTEKQVIVVAGRHKHACIKAALRGRLCSTLITDDITAAALVA